MEDKLYTITKNLQEVINEDYLKEILIDNKTPNAYWGTAPTKRIHIGYLYPAMKIRDLVNAGCTVTILIADLHAYLDSLKSLLEKNKNNTFDFSIESIKPKADYYIAMLKSIYKRMNIDLSKIKFVLGSDYQLSKEVMFNLFSLCCITKVSQAQKAGTEVVKQSKDPMVSSLLYPLLQALDEKYLNADIELGGIDQRKIFGYSRDFMHKINIKNNITYLMNPIVQGLSTKPTNGEIVKMSASDENTKIDLLETSDIIRKKINKAYCIDGNIDDNSVLKIIKNLVFPLNNKIIVVHNNKEIIFDNYDDLEKLVLLGSANGGIHPIDLKNSLTTFLCDFLEPIRKDFELEENKNILELAYGKI